MPQPVIAICGVKNSGKTTLVEKLVRALVDKGLMVATIKHYTHSFEPDVPGRDSYRHRAAGAYGTAVFDREKSMSSRMAGNSTAPQSEPKTLIALATDLPLQVENVPTVDINDIAAMVRIILDRTGLAAKGS